jgi:hypothetical protein
VLWRHRCNQSGKICQQVEDAGCVQYGQPKSRIPVYPRKSDYPGLTPKFKRKKKTGHNKNPYFKTVKFKSGQFLVTGTKIKITIETLIKQMNKK